MPVRRMYLQSDLTSALGLGLWLTSERTTARPCKETWGQQRLYTLRQHAVLIGNLVLLSLFHTVSPPVTSNGSAKSTCWLQSKALQLRNENARACQDRRGRTPGLRIRHLMLDERHSARRSSGRGNVLPTAKRHSATASGSMLVASNVDW